MTIMHKKKDVILSDLSQRFIFAMDKVNVTAYRLAKMTGIAEGTFSHIKTGRNEPSRKILEVFLHHFPQINAAWLYTGIGEMFNSNVTVTNKMQVQKIHNPPYREVISETSVNLYDIDAATNLRTLFDNKYQNIIDSIKIPNMPKCDGAIYVRGDSMYPLLKSGDIVAYREIFDFQNIVFGEMYLIDFMLDDDDFLAVKFVKKSAKEGFIQLVSYNPNHDPMDIPIQSVRAIALIKACVRLNTMM